MKTKIKMNRQQTIAKIDDMMSKCDMRTLSKIYDTAYGGISTADEKEKTITATVITAKTHDPQKLKMLTKEIKNMVPEGYTLFGIKTVQSKTHVRKVFQRVYRPSDAEMMEVKRRLALIPGVSNSYFKISERDSEFAGCTVYKLTVSIDKGAIK